MVNVVWYCVVDHQLVVCKPAVICCKVTQHECRASWTYLISGIFAVTLELVHLVLQLFQFHSGALSLPLQFSLLFGLTADCLEKENTQELSKAYSLELALVTCLPNSSQVLSPALMGEAGKIVWTSGLASTGDRIFVSHTFHCVFHHTSLQARKAFFFCFSSLSASWTVFWNEASQ